MKNVIITQSGSTIGMEMGHALTFFWNVLRHGELCRGLSTPFPRACCRWVNFFKPLCSQLVAWLLWWHSCYPPLLPNFISALEIPCEFENCCISLLVGTSREDSVFVAAAVKQVRNLCWPISSCPEIYQEITIYPIQQLYSTAKVAFLGVVFM